MNKDRLILRLFALAEPTDFSGGFNCPQAIVIKPDVLPTLRLMPPVTDYYVKIHCFAAYPVSSFDLALGKMVCAEKVARQHGCQTVLNIVRHLISEGRAPRDPNLSKLC